MTTGHLSKLMIGCLLPSAAALAQPEGDAIFSCTVWDSSATPLVGAEASFALPSGKVVRAQSDWRGRVVVRGASDWTSDVRISCPGFVTRTVSISRESVVLYRAGGELQITVRDEAGQLVEPSKIRLRLVGPLHEWRGEPLEVNAGSSNQSAARFCDLPPGIYKGWIEETPWKEDASLFEVGSWEIPIDEAERSTIALQATHGTRLSVIMPPPPRDWRGATLHLTDLAGGGRHKTVRSGLLTATVPPGFYSVSIEENGATQFEMVQCLSGPAISLLATPPAEPQEQLPLEIELRGLYPTEPPASVRDIVSGRILASNEAPLQGVGIYFRREGTSTPEAGRRSANGGFFSHDLLPGRYVVELWAGPAGSASRSLVIEPGKRHDLGDIKLDRATRIRVSARSADGHALSHAVVVCERSDAMGEYLYSSADQSGAGTPAVSSRVSTPCRCSAMA